MKQTVCANTIYYKLKGGCMYLCTMLESCSPSHHLIDYNNMNVSYLYKSTGSLSIKRERKVGSNNSIVI